jgi:hypothetical protein
MFSRMSFVFESMYNALFFAPGTVGIGGINIIA